ncbi:MAG: aldehyde dehydrogenase family protein [Gammaproteobacteria bacterium]|nr:aldehyde dehydrogenase family protein [Gammaproteobacteria bacterium]
MTEKLSIRNPRTGQFDYEIGVADATQIESVAANLRRAQRGWLDIGIDARIVVMQSWKAVLAESAEDIVGALVVDTGRRKAAEGELYGVLGMIDRWCEQAPGMLSNEEWPSQGMPDVALQQRQDPYPLLGVISPWNFPFLLSFIDAIPALLAGCAAIIKPSEVTPRFAAPVADTIAKVPALNDVLAFISGDGRSGSALVGNVDVVAFTGSVATGRKVAAAAAEAFIPAFLELGGKDPAVVLPGSDIERAATAILRASVTATGQACQSIERIYVHESQYQQFVDRLSAKAAATKLSYPDIGSGIIGPLIFDRQADIIEAHINDAIAKGAIVNTGGKVLHQGGGIWIEPTVLSNVDHNMAVMCEETFGPLMPVMSYDSEQQALQLANETHYGLSAAVFAPSEDAAIEFAEKIDAGGISINDAGMTAMIFEARKNAYKMSGIGPSRMGSTGMTRFFRQKALYLNRGAVIPIEARAEDAE